MSETYAEPALSPPPAAHASHHARFWRRWPLRILLLLLLLWVAGKGVSLAMQHTRLHRLLTAQIEAAMGRPVEVGSYNFSFWNGAVIEANSVTVGEDPRFGSEYFLRADSMSLRLRWRSLLRGRLDFATLSLAHPSLNLVRDSYGDWNVAEWLPRSAAAAPLPRTFTGPVLPSMATRFRRIEIEAGRINFKLVDRKLPLAFVGVTGTIETDRPGRWRMNLQAIPWRAAVVAQQVGTIQLSGEVGGTSSRLRPAAFDLSWTNASLPDVLRLALGDDFGVRGALAVAINARTEEKGDGWTFQAHANLDQVHRWDLAQRTDNPSLHMNAQLAWSPSAPFVELTQVTLEAPRSHVEAGGRIIWGRESKPLPRAIPAPQVVSSSGEIDAADLLAWARAFHPGVAESLAARGTAQVNAALAGWPPHIANANLSSNGIVLSGAALGKPMHVGRLQFKYDNGVISLLPASLSWGAEDGTPDGSFRLETLTKRSPKSPSSWHVAGSAAQIRDLIASASALGWNPSRGWDLAGRFACDLQWQGSAAGPLTDALRAPTGWIELGAGGKASDGAALRAPFLNLPVEQIRTRVDLKPGVRQLKLSSAEAFGAHWSGTAERNDSGAPWQFNLSADRLSAADLDRWLNPRWRENFLSRMLPFLSSPTASTVSPGELRASGRVNVERFALTPLLVSRLQGEVDLDGRRVSLKKAAGQFFGGQVAGSLDADLEAVPSYHAELDFSRVDVGALIASTPSLAGVSAGSGSAHISLDARGASRADLAASLACEGDARVSNPRFVDFDLWKALGSPSAEAGGARFAAATAKFSCAEGRVQFQTLHLATSEDAAAEGSGSVDFSRKLDLRFQVASYSPDSPPARGGSFRLTGTLDAPKAAPVVVSRRGSR